MADQGTIQCMRVDYSNPRHMDHLIDMLNWYAIDTMGGGKPLTEDVRGRLRTDLKTVSGAVSILAYEADYTDTPVGLINCFPGYSSFRAKPLLNIHDVVVHPEHRGKSIGTALIEAVEKFAREQGHCKISLEVRTDNPAERLYRRLGFTDGGNPMWFLTKDL
jgi:ribosomal protein S18 acetylase RimI-like enzyme